MTDDELRNEIHRVAGCHRHSQRTNRLVVLIQQLLAEANEACAQVCEADYHSDSSPGELADAIRARLEPPV